MNLRIITHIHRLRLHLHYRNQIHHIRFQYLHNHHIHFLQSLFPRIQRSQFQLLLFLRILLHLLLNVSGCSFFQLQKFVGKIVGAYLKGTDQCHFYNNFLEVGVDRNNLSRIYSIHQDFYLCLEKLRSENYSVGCLHLFLLPILR